MAVVEGRQYAKTLAEVRGDHVARYRFAAKIAKGTVADLGCGIGYGSNVMARAGLRVAAYERSDAAISFAKTYWDHPNIAWKACDLENSEIAECDWAVCFEVVEHLAQPESLLSAIKCQHLIASVPNQDVLPFDPVRHSYHFRHYTKAEFGELLERAGWSVTGWYGQAGKQSNVTPGGLGMTLVAVCAKR